jgi:radical SAM protein with 4Fe4S-binding SPASM domain
MEARMNDSEPAVYSRLAPSFLPSTAVLEMTYRCNHRCLFCSCPWEDPAGGFQRLEEMSTDQWKALVGRLAAMGVTSFAFTGGEPLLKEGLWEIIEHAASCTAEHVETVDGSLRSRFGPPKLYLLSNGKLVDAGVLDQCRRLGVQLSMSLPGLATFGEHTGGGDPDQVLENFRAAAALGLPTVVGVTVTRRNLGELYQTIAAAFLAGARQLLMNRFLPGGRGLRYAERLSLDRGQITEMLDTAEAVLTDADRQGSVGTELPKCVVDLSRYRRLEVGTRCSAAIQFFVVDPSGYLRACNHSPVRLDHVDQLDALKTNPYWRRFTQKDYLPAACSGCRLTGSCDGGCREAAHIVTGSLTGVDPVLSKAD